jgi:general stress protein 26
VEGIVDHRVYFIAVSKTYQGIVTGSNFTISFDYRSQADQKYMLMQDMTVIGSNNLTASAAWQSKEESFYSLAGLTPGVMMLQLMLGAHTTPMYLKNIRVKQNMN